MKMSKRLHFLDILRVTATCGVVLLHTVTGVMDNTDMGLYPLEQKIFLAVRDFVCWCVPVFIMISGYLFLNPKREFTFRQMVTIYCRRVLLALFVFGVPFAWIELAAMETPVSPKILWLGVVQVLRGETWSHMWYLYLILILYLLTPAIRWILKRLPKTALYVLLATLFVGSSILPFVGNIFNIPLWTLPGDCIYLFYYLCGYLFVCREKRDNLSFPLFCGLAAILAAGMTVSRLAGFSMQMPYNYPFTVALSLCIFCAGLAGEQKLALRSQSSEILPKNMFWEKASQLCFTIYLIHPLFLNIAYKFFHLTILSFFIGVSLPLFYLVTLTLSCASAWILYKIPVLRKYVL